MAKMKAVMATDLNHRIGNLKIFNSEVSKFSFDKQKFRNRFWNAGAHYIVSICVKVSRGMAGVHASVTKWHMGEGGLK